VLESVTPSWLNASPPSQRIINGSIQAKAMTGAHSLQGLIKWLSREEWRDRFEEVYGDHLIPICDQTDLDLGEIISILGKDWFMSTVWGSAFEDFLT
jgi:hypothetical protein